MFHSFTLLVLALSAVAAPVTHNKRIAQTIAASTAKWEAACRTAGGGEKCNPVSVAAFQTLLAAPGPCAQQDAADNMITLAKTLSNNAEMIRLTQIFVQQPRNTPSSLSTPYCTTVAKSPELAGLYQCQFAGAKAAFVGGSTALPAGVSAISPAGSCPANPSGPVPDGKQLVDIVSTGGAPAPAAPAAGTPPAASTSKAVVVPSSVVASSTAPASPAETSAADSESDVECDDEDEETASPAAPKPTAAAGSADDDEEECSDDEDETSEPASTTAVQIPASTPVAAPSSVVAAPAPAGTAAPVTSANFKKQNGIDAQALNTKFATLTASSSCAATGDQACVDGNAFAQCVSGKFVTTKCAGGLICAALPLVNKAGTSIACTTAGDVDARIKAALSS